MLVEDQAALDEDEVSPDNAIPVDPIWSEVDRVSVCDPPSDHRPLQVTLTSLQ